MGVIDRGLELLGLAGNALGDSRGKALQTRGGSEEQPSRRFSNVEAKKEVTDRAGADALIVLESHHCATHAKKAQPLRPIQKR